MGDRCSVAPKPLLAAGVGGYLLRVCLLAALMLPACTTAIDPLPTSSDLSAPSSGAEAQPPVVDGLPEFPGSLVATPGIPWEPPAQMSEAGTAHDSVASLLLDLRGFLDTDGADVRVGLLGEPADDAAQAYAQVAVSGDDSVAGTEILFEIRRGERGWYMTDAHVRTHCRRSMDLDNDLCV
jgi:hypothetical protein